MHQTYGYSYKYIQSGGKPPPLVFVTVNGNDITIFGEPLTTKLIRGATATDPTLILGSNGTNPTKSVAGAAGRAVVSEPVAGTARKAALLSTSSSVAYSIFEPLLNVNNLDGGLTQTVTGGTVTNVAITGRSGVARIASSTSATASRRASINTNAASLCTQSGRIVFYAPCSLNGTLLNNTTLTGRITVGFLDAFAATAPTDGIFFRYIGGGNWLAVCRVGSIETTADTGVAGVLDAWNDFWIDVNAAGTSVNFYIDGTLVATLTDTIPSVVDRFAMGVHVIRSTAVATDVRIDCDFVYLRVDNPAQNPYGIS